ncbi:MAG TPA: UDP-N-acetylmuramate dehydrogenase [Firmicutes bacterium]|nr:UDP-N-acetylmuramate dehydrogenase [Candidatus Fermentithermobacillaceae bacterium]
MATGEAQGKWDFDEVTSVLHGSRVLYNEPMSLHTSFRIGGPCDLLVLPSDEHDVVAAWVKCREQSIPCYIIGNGTNLLVKDGGVRGCVVKLAPGFSGIRRIDDVTLHVKAGTLLPNVVEAALEAGLSGLEWAVGIPGSVGGAITMNAGAYGGDIASLVKRVEVAFPEGEIRWLPAEELRFSYRHSLFTERDDLLILSAELRLVPGDKAAIKSVMDTRSAEREAKQPLDLPSAGSAFRRPPGYYVGSMIQELGLKGFKVGAAQISPKHAGFIVNTGGATASEVLTLMRIIQEKVKATYGVDLEPEIVVIGEDPRE